MLTLRFTTLRKEWEQTIKYCDIEVIDNRVVTKEEAVSKEDGRISAKEEEGDKNYTNEDTKIEEFEKDKIE